MQLKISNYIGLYFNSKITWAAKATARSPDPHTMLTPIAGTESGKPAFILALQNN